MSNLSRFLEAQERDYTTALQEIKNGRKQSHWIWYIFPQVAGLGMSSTSQYYGIKDIEEAKEYLSHPVLRKRLLEITGEILKLQTNDAERVMGYVDAMKLKSSMTLFHRAEPECELFTGVLKRYFNGEEDWNTLSILGIEK